MRLFRVLLERISIHAAREGGDKIHAYARISSSISIHAAREGGDDNSAWSFVAIAEFQSTPPVKAATLNSNFCDWSDRISIHAAREGGDEKEKL